MTMEKTEEKCCDYIHGCFKKCPYTVEQVWCGQTESCNYICALVEVKEKDELVKALEGGENG